ncbi:hypothetical protein C8J57DRAFT_61402 [Mycena rebaudengoi]|nr:hypothetical protein C8J57DRAFT_61402 [Mycena rebaudengoi]
MLGRLPAFPALCTLTLWLSPNRQAECMLTALNPMPNLTSLVFRVVLESHFVKGQYDDFREILYTAFPWDGSESMKASSCGHFHFSVISRSIFAFPATRTPIFDVGCAGR